MTGLLVCAFSLFLIGSAIRILRVVSMPAHVRWELYPVPENSGARARIMLAEIFLLKGVYDQNRPLWLWSWLFHSAVYLMLAVGVLSIIAAAFPGSLNLFTGGGLILSAIAFGCGTVGCIGLIIMRFRPRLRPLTSFATVFNLLFLLFIFVSGLIYVSTQSSAADRIVLQIRCLFGIGPSPVFSYWGILHLCLIALFGVYFPFTAMAHGMLKYFMYHWVRWDDRPAGSAPALNNRMSRYLAYPVSWSAPHIREEGGKNWSDVVLPKASGKADQ
jgi:nitrate reductase gamma subunit